MTDPLAEALKPLFDSTDRRDWKDVRRRAEKPKRRSRFVLGAVMAVAGAVFVVSALGAVNDWWFSKRDDAFANVRSFRFGNDEWSLTTIVPTDRHFFCYLLHPVRGDGVFGPSDGTCGGALIAVPGIPATPGFSHPPVAPTGPAFGARNVASGEAGHLWFGDARAGVSVVELIDSRGRLYRTTTFAPPSRIATTFRLWLITLPRSASAVTIAGYDHDGALVERRSILGLWSLTLH